MTYAVRNQPPEDRRRFEEIAAQLLTELPRLIERMMSEHLRGFVRPEDIFQDVALAFRDALERFEPRTADVEGDLRALLTRIARNRVIDAARRYERMIPSVEQEVLDQAKQDGHTPSRIAAKDQTLAAVRDCLAKIEARERNIIERRLADGLTFAEIARELGMTEGQVDGLYRRALRRMRECLGSSQHYQFASSRD